MPAEKKPFKLTSSQMFLAAAVGLVLISVVLFGQLVGRSGKSNAKEALPKTEPLVLVTRPVAMGQLISHDDVSIVQWPVEYLPKEHTIYHDDHDVIGRVARKDLLPGEPLFRQKVAGDDIKGGLPTMIPDGMRAVTIQVTDIKGVAGMIKPTDRVDVLASVQTDIDGQDITLSKTILQNAQVLAVEQTLDDDRIVEAEPLELEIKDKKSKKKSALDEKKAREKEIKAKLDARRRGSQIAKNVTLALWPDDAEKVMLAEEMGTLRLTLRAETDHTTGKAGGVTESEMFHTTALKGFVAPKEDAGALHGRVTETVQTQSAPLSAYSVEVYEGTDHSTVNF